MDELAYEFVDGPGRAAAANYAERDQNEDKPFSSKALRDCYAQGAERFGWSQAQPQPRSMREGSELIGWGMATGVWDALHAQASARHAADADGTLEVAQRDGGYRHRHLHDP